MTENHETELIRRYLQGDAGAFDQLYEHYRLPVFNYLRRQLEQPAVVEDIFQDIWLRVIRSLKMFKTETSFSAWIFTIAHNRLVDHWRQQRDMDSDEILERTPDNTHPTDYQQFLRDCVARLRQLIGLIKPDQRNAFLLQQESGLTLEQIASVMAVGRETVKSRLRYAMDKLRAGLSGCDETGDDND